MAIFAFNLVSAPHPHLVVITLYFYIAITKSILSLQSRVIGERDTGRGAILACLMLLECKLFVNINSKSKLQRAKENA